MHKKILITGAAGFLGSNLARHFTELGHYVIGIDNFITGNARNIEALLKLENFKFIKGDIIDYSQLQKVTDIDLIFNFACPASPPKYVKYAFETLDVCYLGTRNLVQLSKLTGAKLIHASTSEIYGDPQISPQSETYYGYVNSFGPRACYDEGKRVSEALLFEAQRTYELKVLILRIFNTYGPNMDINDGRVVTNFIRSILNMEPITIYGNGSQTRSLCFISDFLNAVDILLTEDKTGVVNIGNDEEISILDLAETTENIFASHLPREFKPLPTNDPLQRKPDLKIIRSLGWRPVWSLKDGLIETKRALEATS